MSLEKLGDKCVCTVELEIQKHDLCITGSGCGEIHCTSGANDSRYVDAVGHEELWMIIT